MLKFYFQMKGLPTKFIIFIVEYSIYRNHIVQHRVHDVTVKLIFFPHRQVCVFHFFEIGFEVLLQEHKCKLIQ